MSKPTLQELLAKQSMGTQYIKHPRMAACLGTQVHNGERIVWLINMVAHKAPGLGALTAFREELEREAKAAGYSAIVVENVLWDWLLAWFERHGYEKYGRAEPYQSVRKRL